MKRVVLSCLLLLGGASFLHAGTIFTLADGPQINGQLSLTTAGVHVDPGNTEVNQSNVLEADFGETPFQLDVFAGGTGDSLPADWTGQAIGTNPPGSMSYAGGTLTLNVTGAPRDKQPTQRNSDSPYFVGRTWTGNGELTVRLNEIDTKLPETLAGLMVRDTLDPDSVMYAEAAATLSNGGLIYRQQKGGYAQVMPNPLDLPVWLRLSRYGSMFVFSTSTDGAQWDLAGLQEPKFAGAPWIGLFADARHDTSGSKVLFDQISLGPLPSSAQVYPPGIVLQSGTSLAGVIVRVNFDAAKPDEPAYFRRGSKEVVIPRSKIAALTMLPTPRSQLADMATKVGLLMKNGDAMDGDFTSVNGSEAQLSSILLGPASYPRADIRACLFHAVQPALAPYEIRLRDGSIIRASGVEVNTAGVTIAEVSGVTIPVAQDEIAQFRAGTSLVQPMAELAWKATTAAPATGGAPANPAPAVHSWEGPNQEQILEAAVDTTVEFPLTGKFRAMGVKIALSPESPAGSALTVRVLADGKEVARTPTFKVGDPPRFMQVAFQNPKTVALQANSPFPGAKVLFIDPIAFRNSSP